VTNNGALFDFSNDLTEESVLIVTGNFVQNQGGRIGLSLAGTDPAEYDHIQISGSAHLAGR